MEVVEIYRGYEITRAEKKGREGYRAVSTFTFDIKSARFAIDKAHRIKGNKHLYLLIDTEYSSTRYLKIQPYSMAQAYTHLSSVKYINTGNFGKNVHNLQVL